MRGRINITRVARFLPLPVDSFLFPVLVISLGLILFQDSWATAVVYTCVVIFARYFGAFSWATTSSRSVRTRETLERTDSESEAKIEEEGSASLRPGAENSDHAANAERAKRISESLPQPTVTGLVSVIMPVRNSERFLEEALTSALSSRGINFEILAIDDESSDSSPAILGRFQISHKQLRVFTSRVSHGPYVCRNIGVVFSRGEFIAFHDSDDLQDSQRIAQQISILKADPEVQVVLCHAARWESDMSERLQNPRFASVTMVFRRELIDTVGYFDSVRWGGDSEFIARVKKHFGPRSVRVIPQELYFLRFHEGSLTAAPGVAAYERDGDRLRLRLSSAREEYQRAFSAWHASREKPHIEFPLVERPFEVIDSQQSDYFLGAKFLGGMASFPARENFAPEAIGSIHQQLDHLTVALNQYESLPDYASIFPEVSFEMLGNQDLKDLAKFFAVRGKPGFIFLLDDDIFYPADYVLKMSCWMALEGRSSIVGVHGVNVLALDGHYLDNREVFHFQDSSPGCYVDYLGTGTVAFYSDGTFPGEIDLSLTGHADLFLATEAKRASMNCLCVPRGKGWLREFSRPGPESLWRKNKDSPASSKRAFEESLGSFLGVEKTRGGEG